MTAAALPGLGQLQVKYIRVGFMIGGKLIQSQMPVAVEIGVREDFGRDENRNHGRQVNKYDNRQQATAKISSPIRTA